MARVTKSDFSRANTKTMCFGLPEGLAELVGSAVDAQMKFFFGGVICSLDSAIVRLTVRGWGIYFAEGKFFGFTRHTWVWH